MFQYSTYHNYNYQNLDMRDLRLLRVDQLPNPNAVEKRFQHDDRIIDLVIKKKPPESMILHGGAVVKLEV